MIYIYLSKMIPPLMMPLGLGLILLLGFFACLRIGLRRLASAAVVMAFLVLWISSSPLVANFTIASLERKFPAQSPENLPDGLCAVVLGGAVASLHGNNGLIELGEAADRMYAAAVLYKQNKVSTIVVSGGNQPWNTSGYIEGNLIREWLVQTGVNEQDIHVDAKSRNTFENAKNSRGLLESMNCRQSLLITSAGHMRRALATFNAAGIDMLPFPVDFRSEPEVYRGIMDFIPTAGSLRQTSEAMREYLGILVYRLRGWS